MLAVITHGSCYMITARTQTVVYTYSMRDVGNKSYSRDSIQVHLDHTKFLSGIIGKFDEKQNN